MIIFFVTFLPQFVSPTDPEAAKKLLFLGLFFTVINIPVCGALVLSADAIARLLGRSARITRFVDYLFAGVLGAFAVKLILTEVAVTRLAAFSRLVKNTVCLTSTAGWKHTQRESDIMSVAKVIELTSTSAKSFEDAIQKGIARANKTLKNVEGAWIKEQKVMVKDGKINGYRVNMMVTFVLDGDMSI